MTDIQDYHQNAGRKREFEGLGGVPPPDDYGGPGGPGKKPRFDFQESEGTGEESLPATLRILIRNSDAGGIIGKGGDNIKRLRKQFDCQVVLPDSAGSPERVMTVMGAIPNCVRVLDDVLNGLASDYRSSQPGEGDKEVQLLIPQPFMGTIIGTGGTKIKDLRTRTKTNIKIFSDPMPGSNERSIQLIGSNAQIVECVEHFLDDIGKKEPREPIYLYEPGQNFNGPPDMGFSPRGGRGGGARGGPPFRGRGGRGGRGITGHSGAPPSSGVGYGSSSQPSVGYAAQPPPVHGMPSAPNLIPPGGPPPHGGAAPVSSYPPSQPPIPLVQGYPPQAAPSQGYAPQTGASTPGSQSQQVTIPGEYTDAIVGINGANLQQIKSQSSCEITLEPPKPGVNERVITIMGSPNGIQFAQQLMQNSVRQHHPNV